jgi:hypothetical protein
MFLVRAAVLLELLAEFAHVAPERIDDRIELRVEVVGGSRDTHWLAHRRSV